MLTFDARLIARGWLAVAVASSKDKARPQLHRTISIEEFDTGVRLVATDSVMLLRTWVPALDCEWEPEPDIDAAPFFTAVAIDPHGRGKGFLAHVLRLAEEAEKDDTAPTIDVTVRLAATSLDLGEDPGPARTFDGFEPRHVVLDLPGAERLKLPAYDGSYPTWQRVVGGFHPVRTAALGLNPEVMARLAKVAPLFPGRHIGWTFGGVDKMARVEVVDGFPYVEGVVMPVRWDFDTDEPRDDTPPPPPADGPAPDDSPDGDTADVTPAADPAPTPVPTALRFTVDEVAALRILADGEGVTEGPATNPDARVVTRPAARNLLRLGFVRRAHFDDRLRPVYVITPAGGKAL